MQFWVFFCRVAALLAALPGSFPHVNSEPIKKTAVGKYPLQVHRMYQARITHQKKTPKPAATWSSWSSWSPCSRTCGGGVTHQTRHCVSRPADPRFIRRQRRRRQANFCVGLYKRIHLCNNQECPPGRDFRREQCAAFNGRAFKGKTYDWEPFLESPNECALNCRPAGRSFYATLNRTVIDGTPCRRPMSSYGKEAPRGTRGVCIDGSCKSVNANGVVGSLDDNSPEECAACLRGTCRSINGLYTRPDLPPGYSLVAQIPAGACKILVQQLKHTRNFLALRHTNGSFILNGDWKISSSRNVEGAGVKFTYVKQDGGNFETISSPGPLQNPVDIMIVNFQANPGIKYGYSLPVDPSLSPGAPQIAPPLLKRPLDNPYPEPRRLETSFNSLSQRDEATRPIIAHRRTRLRRRFVWKISGISACSKSCGGGFQATVTTCVREHSQTPVSEKRCAHLDKPMSQPIRCSVKDCPPHWEAHWTPCSVSCGSGVQQHVPQCVQELSTGRTVILNEIACPKSNKPEIQVRPCAEDSCDDGLNNELPQEAPEGERRRDVWTTSPWSACSVSCGTGHRSRSVSCPSGHCHSDDCPKHIEYCENPPCAPPSRDSHLDSNSWLLTEWSSCSESCGTGTQTRQAVCPYGNCTSSSRPEISRACSSDKECGGHWVTGAWGPCGDSCSAPARQTRAVYCVVKIRGSAHITNDMTCSAGEKPAEEEPCEGRCGAKWYMGDWGACEGVCPSGVQRRDVRCLDAHGVYATGCGDDEMPISKRQCVCRREDTFKPPQDEPADRSCSDRIRHCYLAVQARLCQYPYYTTHCCVSCRRAQQDPLE